MRNAKKNLQGTVVSTKMEKTIIVTVETKRKHPLYHKQVKYSKRYKAHDEKSTANIGDIVIITETRPLSATKRFRLSSIVERAK